jgi:hypothetical protein
MPHDVIQIEPQPPDGDATGPEALAREARRAIFKALAILRDEMGMPVERLIAMQAARRPDLLLRAVSRFSATPKTDLPASVQAMHLQALRALAAQGAKVIDGEASPMADPFFD